MAVVTGPLMSMDASGNMGAINFTRWRGMNVVRSVYSYTDSPTAAQTAARAVVSSVSVAWGQTLTAAQRQTWCERAHDQVFTDRLGKSYRPNGYMLFMKWNTQLVNIGSAIQATAPIGGEKCIVTEMTALPQGAAGKVIVSLLGIAPAVPDCAAIVYFQAGPYDSEGRHPINPEYRRASVKKPAATFTATGLIAEKFYWWRAFCVFSSGIRTNNWEVQGSTPI